MRKLLLAVIVTFAIVKPSLGQSYSFDVTYNGVQFTCVMLGSDSVSISAKTGTTYTGYLTLPSTVTCNSMSLPPSYWHSYKVTRIGSFSFKTGITGVYMPYWINCIAPGAFKGCTGLTTLTSWSPNLHKISDNAFQNCTGLRYVELPSSGTMTIGKQAFSGCTDLDSVYIGSAVNMIDDKAFENCHDLDIIRIQNNAPPAIGTNVFLGVPYSTQILLPCGSNTTLGGDWGNFVNVSTYGDVSISAVSSNDVMGYVNVVSTSSCIGDQVTLFAIPHPGYRFTNWSDGETANPRTITLTGNVHLTADFSLITNDTVYLSVHDTTVIVVHDTSFIEVPFEIHDTIIMTEFVHIHDTIYSQIYDTTTIHDTIVQIEYVTIHDTAYYPVHDTTIVLQTDTITYIEYDTIEHLFYDTIILTDTLFLAWTDTIWMTDTIWEHDTIVVYDTIYLPHVSHPLLTAFPSVSGDATNSDASVSYTVGQVAAMQIECEAGSVNIGVQQSYVVEAVSVDGTDSLPFQVSVFPNPTTDNVSISIPDNSKVVSFYLFTVEGRLLQRGRLVPGERQLDLKDFPAGNYMLRLQFGKNVNMYRIIKIK